MEIKVNEQEGERQLCPPPQPNQSIDASYYVRAESGDTSRKCKKRTFQQMKVKRIQTREVEGKRVPGNVLSDHSVELTMSCIQISYSSPFVSALCSFSLCDHQRERPANWQTGDSDIGRKCPSGRICEALFAPRAKCCCCCFWNTQ